MRTSEILHVMYEKPNKRHEIRKIRFSFLFWAPPDITGIRIRAAPRSETHDAMDAVHIKNGKGIKSFGLCLTFEEGLLVSSGRFTFLPYLFCERSQAAKIYGADSLDYRYYGAS